jgi:hypothetical protein
MKLKREKEFENENGKANNDQKYKKKNQISTSKTAIKSRTIKSKTKACLQKCPGIPVTECGHLPYPVNVHQPTRRGAETKVVP